MIVTIITAAWRIEGLKNIINCINRQTYTRWEHIIVNDNNDEIRKELIPLCEDPRRHWIDIGVRTHYFGCFARNIGTMVSFSYIKEHLRNVTDEWVCFFDDDNYWEDNHLESLVNIKNKYNNATLIGSDMIFRGVRNKEYKKIIPCKFEADNCDLGQFMYNKILFDKYGYFKARPERKITWDFELIKKITAGECDSVHLTGLPTFIFNHRDR